MNTITELFNCMVYAAGTLTASLGIIYISGCLIKSMFKNEK